MPRRALWLIVPALWCAPALFFAKTSAWIAPLCLGGILCAIVVARKTQSFFATFPPSGSPQKSSYARILVHGGILLAFYSAAFVWFYSATDTWEIWTWLMDSSTQYGDTLRTDQEVTPTLFEVVQRPYAGRWHGPHITHGLLHSKPMVFVLKQFVREDTRRFSVNQIMRVINSLCALGCLPLFFLALRRIKLLRHVDVAVIAAFTSPGIFVVSAKGHWLGISYGIACLTFWLGVGFLASGRWRYLLGFLTTWSLLLAAYTSAQFFFIICGGLTILYLLFSSRNSIPLWRMGVMIVGAASIMYGLIGFQHPEQIVRHFQGNGESLFEIRENQIELNRFSQYWQAAASRYGLEHTLTWPLFYRAGLGMMERNIRTLLKNFLGSGRFFRLWLTPHHGEIKSFGFVLPWFLIISVFLLIIQRRWRDSAWEILVLCGPALIIGLLLLLTWDMSVHRVFSINLMLAAFAGALYDHVLCQCRIATTIDMKLPLFIALYGQLLLFLLLESAAIGA